MTTELNLIWNGPHSFAGAITSPQSKLIGLYLWTIPYRDGYLVYYVGKTEGNFRNFGVRLGEEMARFEAGLENLPDLHQFKEGKPFADLVYKPKNAKTASPIFQNNPLLAKQAREMKNLLQIFVAPIDDLTVRISHAEDRAVWDLWEHGGRCDNFLSNYERKHKSKPPLRLSHHCDSATIWGLTKQLTE